MGEITAPLPPSVGKANVTSLVEKESRFTFLLPNEDKRSAAVITGIVGALRPLPEDARRTVTFDRGGEFAGYAALDRGPVATTVRSRAAA